MKEIPRSKKCWVENCEEELKEWPYCEKHRRMTDKGHKLDIKTPGIKGFDNTPTKT